MKSFLQEQQALLDEIRAVTPEEILKFEPEDEIQTENGEKSFGVLSADLKAVATVMLRHQSILHESCDEFHGKKVTLNPDSDDDLPALGPQADHINEHEKLDYLRTMLWLGIKLQFPTKCLKAMILRQELSICKGWKVKASKPEPEPQYCGIPGYASEKDASNFFQFMASMGDVLDAQRAHRRGQRGRRGPRERG